MNLLCSISKPINPITQNAQSKQRVKYFLFKIVILILMTKLGFNSIAILWWYEQGQKKAHHKTVCFWSTNYDLKLTVKLFLLNIFLENATSDIFYSSTDMR